MQCCPHLLRHFSVLVPHDYKVICPVAIRQRFYCGMVAVYKTKVKVQGRMKIGFRRMLLISIPRAPLPFFRVGYLLCRPAIENKTIIAKVCGEDKNRKESEVTQYAKSKFV